MFACQHLLKQYVALSFFPKALKPLPSEIHDVLPNPPPLNMDNPCCLTNPLPPHSETHVSYPPTHPTPLPSEIYGVFPEPPPRPPPTIRDLWCLFRPSHLPLENHHIFADPPPSPTLGDPWCLSRPPPPTYHQRPMVSFRIPPPTIRDPWRLLLTPPERWVPSLYDSFDHFPRLLAALIELISIDVFWHIFRSNLFRPRWRKRANPVQP